MHKFIRLLIIIFIIHLFVNYAYADPQYPSIVTKDYMLQTSQYLVYETDNNRLSNLVDNDTNTYYYYKNIMNTMDTSYWINININNSIRNATGLAIIIGKNKKHLDSDILEPKFVKIIINKTISTNLLIDGNIIQYIDIPIDTNNIHIELPLYNNEDTLNMYISELQLLNKDGNNLFKNSKYYIDSTGGEYPQYSIRSYLDGMVFSPDKIGYSNGICGVEPSDDFTEFAFETSEVGEYGLVIYDILQDTHILLLNNYWVQSVKWVDTNTISAIVYNEDCSPQKVIKKIKSQ